MPKTDPIRFRLEPDEKAALEKAAVAERRPIAQLSALAVVEWLRERGYLKIEGRKK